MSAPNVGVCDELSLLVSKVGMVLSVGVPVIKGDSCHDNCSVSSVQLVISLPKCVSQGVLLMSSIHIIGPYHDTPLL